MTKQENKYRSSITDFATRQQPAIPIPAISGSMGFSLLVVKKRFCESEP